MLKFNKIWSLPSHPSQPPLQQQHVNTLAYLIPVSYLHVALIPCTFSHCHPSYPTPVPTFQHVFKGCNFQFVVGPAHVHVVLSML